MRLWHRFHQTIARFRRERAGTAATEFAILFPVMMFAYLGAVTAFQAYHAQNTVTRGTTAIVDLVSRQNLITSNFRDRIFDVGEALVADVSTGEVTVIFTSVINPSGDGNEVDWSYANIGGAELETDDLDGLDIPVVPTGESLIVGVIKIKHTPRFDVLDVSEMDMTYVSFRRPRFMMQIPTTI